MVIQQLSQQEEIREILSMPRDLACARSAQLALTHVPVRAYYPNAAPGQAPDIGRIAVELLPAALPEDQFTLLGPYCIDSPRFIRGIALWAKTESYQAVRNGNC